MGNEQDALGGYCKDVNLAKELQAKGIALPHWARTVAKAVDISTHQFDVALSFPGEVRGYVEPVVSALERNIGPNSYFYDNNYVSQLARPSLDVLLQDIYQNRAKLVVVFLCSDYQDKEWCGIEFRAVKEIMMKQRTIKSCSSKWMMAPWRECSRPMDMLTVESTVQMTSLVLFRNGLACSRSSILDLSRERWASRSLTRIDLSWPLCHLR